MTLQVVGVGLGRTGTNSLKLALEELLGGPCHHMVEVFARPEQVPLWQAAADGEPDWAAIYDGYVATVDWPGAAFWRELVDQYPDALVLLSKRESADAWWASASRTIFTPFLDRSLPKPGDDAWFDTVRQIFDRSGIDPTSATAAMRGYERHLEEVRAEVPSERLIEWTAGDGWGPLCDALGLDVPTTAFPHVNTTDEFRARAAARAHAVTTDRDD